MTFSMNRLDRGEYMSYLRLGTLTLGWVVGGPPISPKWNAWISSEEVGDFVGSFDSKEDALTRLTEVITDAVRGVST